MHLSIHLGTYISLSRPCPTFTTSYAHTIVLYSALGHPLNGVVDSGASHHVTMDLAALALHESYTASNNVIISDGLGLSIAHIGSFSLIYLPTPLLFNNVLHMPAMSKNFISISTLCTDSLINFLFFDSFFQVQDHHMGVTLVRGQHKDLPLWFCSLRLSPRFMLSPCGIVISVIRLWPFFSNFLVF